MLLLFSQSISAIPYSEMEMDSTKCHHDAAMGSQEFRLEYDLCWSK